MANWNMGHNHFPADVGVQCGSTDLASVGANTYADVAVTFPAAFYAVPVVVASPSAGYAGGVTIEPINITASGFTARIWHFAEGTSNIAVNWIAVGTPA